MENTKTNKRSPSFALCVNITNEIPWLCPNFCCKNVTEKRNARFYYPACLLLPNGS